MAHERAFSRLGDTSVNRMQPSATIHISIRSTLHPIQLRDILRHPPRLPFQRAGSNYCNFHLSAFQLV